MPEIIFEIDQATGVLKSEFIGITGEACDRMEALIAEFTGTADEVKIKPQDYYVKPKGQTRVRKG